MLSQGTVPRELGHNTVPVNGVWDLYVETYPPEHLSHRALCIHSSASRPVPPRHTALVAPAPLCMAKDHPLTPWVQGSKATC